MRFVFSLAVLCLSLPAFSQKKIVVIGSSTAEGLRASTPDSNWVRRVSNHYKRSLGLVDTVYNLGTSGSSVWWGMPATSTYWVGRSGVQPRPHLGVSKAVELLQGLPNPSDGVIIVNYPTNDFQYAIPVAYSMQAFRTIYDSATRYGNRCYITTTQPRTDPDFNKPEIKRVLAELKDSIIDQFGDNVIDFWTPLVNLTDTSLKADLRNSDLIHCNDKGYGVLAGVVIAKEIFPNVNLPLVWGEFVTLIDGDRVRLQWSTLEEQNTDRFVIEHSTDGIHYNAIATVPGRGSSVAESHYSFIHTTPNTNGNNFYRIREIDLSGKAFLSLIRVTQFKGSKGVLVKMTPNPVQNVLQANVSANDITILVIDGSGRTLLKKQLPPGMHPIDLQGLAAGAYHVIVIQKGRQIESHDIIKQ